MSAKIEVTQQQRDNQLSAREMWLTVPAENVSFRLLQFRDFTHFKEYSQRNEHEPPDCGTVACFGGWCAWWPYFRARGVTSNGQGAPRLSGDLDVGEELFGVLDAFHARKDGNESVSDWQIVMDRIDCMLANTEVSA